MIRLAYDTLFDPPNLSLTNPIKWLPKISPIPKQVIA
jgi:hypothetical protein